MKNIVSSFYIFYQASSRFFISLYVLSYPSILVVCLLDAAIFLEYGRFKLWLVPLHNNSM